nr:hypothetical protein [Sedimentibacter sp.]
MKNIFEIYKENECLEGVEVTKNSIISEQFSLFESFMRSTNKIADPIVNKKNANCIMRIFINSTNELQIFNQSDLKIIFALVKKVVINNEKLVVVFEEIPDIKNFLIEKILKFSLKETIDFLDYFIIITNLKSSLYNAELKNYLIMIAGEESLRLRNINIPELENERMRIRKIPELLDYLWEENIAVYPEEVDPYEEFFQL